MNAYVRIIPMLALAFVAGRGHCAEADAAAFAEAMKQVRRSDGFEARMNVSVFKADGQHLTTFKFAVIGQIGKDKQRVLIRGITPETVRARYIAAERGADGRIRAIGYTNTADAGTTRFDPGSGLFGSGVVLWDMFAPWWNWPRQEWVESRMSGTQGCSAIRSQSDGNAPVREVVSCIDRAGKLSLNTQLYGRQHKLLRSIAVERTMRKESGALAAKKLTITEADGTVTEVEVYSGDENYLVTADTFAALDAQRGGEN